VQVNRGRTGKPVPYRENTLKLGKTWQFDCAEKHLGQEKGVEREYDREREIGQTVISLPNPGYSSSSGEETNGKVLELKRVKAEKILLGGRRIGEPIPDLKKRKGSV